VLIDIAALDLKDPETWAAYNGLVLLLANDGRGYMLGFGSGYYVAGCRVFTFDQAVEHWSNPTHESEAAAALLLAAVQDHQARQ